MDMITELPDFMALIASGPADLDPKGPQTGWEGRSRRHVYKLPDVKFSAYVHSFG